MADKTYQIRIDNPEQMIEQLTIPALQHVAAHVYLESLPVGTRIELLELLLALLTECRASLSGLTDDNGKPLWPHVVAAAPGAFHRGQTREELEAERDRVREELRRGARDAGAAIVDDPKQRELEQQSSEGVSIVFLPRKKERH